MRSKNERQPVVVASTCISLRCNYIYIYYTYIQYTYIFIFMYSLYFITFQRPGTRPVTKPLRSIRPEQRGTFHTQFWLIAIYILHILYIVYIYIYSIYIPVVFDHRHLNNSATVDGFTVDGFTVRGAILGPVASGASRHWRAGSCGFEGKTSIDLIQSLEEKQSSKSRPERWLWTEMDEVSSFFPSLMKSLPNIFCIRVMIKLKWLEA